MFRGLYPDPSNQVANFDVNVLDEKSANAIDEDSDDDDDDDFYDQKYNAYKEKINKNQNQVLYADAQELTLFCASAGIFPHPNDCSKFHECIEYSDEIDESIWSLVLYECVFDTIFNPKNETCDYPENIDPPRACPGPHVPSGNTDNELIDEQQKADNDNDNQKLSATNETNGICSSAGYFVHPDNCSKYYQCSQESNGSFSVVQFECPGGTIWDSNRNTCNPLEDVKTTQKCRNLIKSYDAVGEKEEDDHNEDDTRPNTYLDINKLEMDVEKAEQSPIVQKDDDELKTATTTIPAAETPESAESTDGPSDEDNEPDADDADKTPQTPPIQAEKENSTNGTSGKPSGNATDFICPSDGTFADSSDCQKYILCDEDFNVTLTCRRNEVYDSFLKECSRDWSACSKTPKCTEDDQRLADPERIEYYYICSVRGYSPRPIYEIQRNRCPENSVFDQAQQKCVPSTLETANKS